MQGEFQQAQPQQQQYAPQSSTPAAGGSLANTSSHGSGQQPLSATQFRVARIIEFADVHNASDVQPHGEVILDLRSPAGSASASDAAVRVVQFYIGDGPSEFSSGSVRTIIESMPNDSEMCNILIDSGADISIFPSSMSGLGVESPMPLSRLQDAQGNSIPVEGAKDVEIHLMDQHGRTVVLKESVCLSSQITQPIIYFGHLMANGWRVDAREQSLVHTSGISIPIEMQNRSMSVRGWIRVLREEPQALGPMVIRAVRADVFGELSNMRAGWNLNTEGVGTGKHFGHCYQDPRVVCPTLSGSKFRTTLIQNGAEWLVLELCEPIESLIDLAAEFRGYPDDRYILTIISSSERPPHAMGFRLLDDDEQPHASDPVFNRERAEEVVAGSTNCTRR